MRRVLVCGGRDYSNTEVLYRVLDAEHAAHGIAVVISGMARGADSLAAEWAASRGVELAPFFADWKRNGGVAGLMRNQKMLHDGKPDLVIAFPGGHGTDDMKRRAKKAGVVVLSVQR